MALSYHISQTGSTSHLTNRSFVHPGLSSQIVVEFLDQVEGVISGFVQIDLDARWVIQGAHDHVPVIISAPAFHIIFPDHFLLVQSLAGDKKLVGGNEVLVHKTMDESKIRKVFSHIENEVFPFAKKC